MYKRQLLLIYGVGDTGCGDVTAATSAREETVLCGSPEHHPAEPSPIKASINRPLIEEPIIIDSMADEQTPGIDNTIADSDAGVRSGSIPVHSDVATDLTSGHAAPQAADDAGPVTDTPLNDDVLRQCVIQMIHRFSLPLSTHTCSRIHRHQFNGHFQLNLKISLEQSSPKCVISDLIVNIAAFKSWLKLFCTVLCYFSDM